MPSLRTTARIALSLTLAASISLLSGCAEESPTTAPVSVAEPTAMSLEARDSLPEGFPIEIPVLSADITIAETTGEPNVGPWHYESASTSSRDAVVDWYRQAYTGRSWEIATDTPDGTGYDLAFIKGSGAWSTLRVTETDSGCTIECWAGIGVLVPPQAMPPSGQGLDA